MSAPPVEIFGRSSLSPEASLPRRFSQRLVRTIPAINTIETKRRILTFFIMGTLFWNNGILEYWVYIPIFSKIM
jgi:hypothetical protein